MGLLYLRDVTTLRLDRAACSGCGDCVGVCPREVLEMADGRAAIREPDACIECGACALNCPTGALTVRAGVGCASGIINGMLGRDGDCCCVPGEGGDRGDLNKSVGDRGRGCC
ncbi:MAG TPA: mercury methylation ferredoxin HgcB [Candidatus Methanoperedens sp.]|nr:mercury methylation ferredoxin HgcB [Candidatus Methanoperedens sp.]